MIIAHSLAFDGDLDLTNDYRDASLIWQPTVAPDAHAILHGGRLRPVHDIGMPLALAPVVRVAYTAAERLGEVLPNGVLQTARLSPSLLFRPELSLFMAILAGLLAREVFLVVGYLGVGGRSAFAWALLFASTPPIVSHAFLFFTEIPTALIALVVFRRLSLQPLATAAGAWLLGALNGFLLLVHARNVGLVVGLTLVAAMMVRRRALAPRLLIIFVVAVAAGAVARTLTTFVLWGQWLTTPHATFGEAMSVGGHLAEVFARASGLLFDREHGLFAYAPVYLLAAAGLLLLSRHRQQLSRDLFVVLACYLMPVLSPLTNVHGWNGGWSPAARFLVPVAALLWIGVYWYATQAGRVGQWLAAALIAVQVSIDAYLWQFPKRLWNDADGVSVLPWGRWLPTWRAPDATELFGAALVAWCVHLPLLEVCAVGRDLGSRRRGRDQDGTRGW
jgi:hypothetical protein